MKYLIFNTLEDFTARERQAWDELQPTITDKGTTGYCAVQVFEGRYVMPIFPEYEYLFSELELINATEILFEDETT